MKTNLLLALILNVLFINCTKHNDPSVDQTYRFQKMLTVDGLSRTYTVNLPPNYYESNSYSVVIAMHGGGGSADQFESSCLLTNKANKEGFIVVYPEGVKSNGLLGARTWNAGNCCDYAVEQNIDDVHFIQVLLDTLIANYKINPKKVCATGHSNGGMMAYRLACEIPDRIAAIVPNGCTNASSYCNPAQPVPVLHMHSMRDENVPYLGGRGGGIGTTQLNLLPVETTLKNWAATAKCKVTAQIIVDDEKYKLTTWSDCDQNFVAKFYLTKDGGHAWPGALPGSLIGDAPSKVINANDLLWQFFQEHQLK